MTKVMAELSDIREVLTGFSFPGPYVTVNPFGSGHINDTFLIAYTTNDQSFLLQRINHHVFKNVDLLMKNIVTVTSHLTKKIKENYPDDSNRRVMNAIQACDAKYYYKDKAGNYWRVFNFLKNTKSYDVVTTDLQAYEGGCAFGEFLTMLSDLDPLTIHESIPDFHNVNRRLVSFWRALTSDRFHRARLVGSEIEIISSRSAKMGYILKRASEGRLPLRVTHNDTKFNNVLLDQNDKAQCVIDLDTAMPGYAAYDFGDAIRSIVNTAAENEEDVEKIDININLFRSFTAGYLNETITILTNDEIDSLIEGALLFPFMQAVRFLTDYLEGDHYYKTAFENHNLQRARAQFALFLKMENNYDELRAIVYETANSLKSQFIISK